MLLVDKLKENKDFIIIDNYNEKLNHYHLKVTYRGNVIFNESRLISRCCGGNIDRLKNIFNMLLQDELNQLRIEN